MNQARVLYHIARADFLERVRRYSFLLTLGGAVYFGYLAATGQLMLRMGNVRGIFNSAWIGGLMAVVCSTFLSLVGFYVVKNTIERDRDTRVGQILATTPISKFLYVLGKTISNFAVLAAMVVILALSGIAMQFWQGEDRHLELWKLLAPFLLLALPAMAVVAAVAVLFETIPLLRGGFGNVLYFFAWTAGIALPIGLESPLGDPSGLMVLAQSMLTARGLSFSHGDFSFSLEIGGSNPVNSTFRWEGIHWTPGIILARLAWMAAAIGVACVAAMLFDRFDAAPKVSMRAAAQPQTLAEPSPPAVRVPVASLTPISFGAPHFRFSSVVTAELRLMLKGRAWWWYLIAAGLSIACLVAPLDAGRGIIIAAWIWPVLLWSQMGSREARNNTQSLIFSSAHALQRQLPAAWTAGVVVAALTGGGLAIRLLLAGDIHSLAAWMAGVLFIPSLALALGVWSGTGKPFEALYTVWWYIGPAHQTPGLDFLGTTSQSASPETYLLLAAGLLAASYWGRRLRLGYT